MNMTDDWDNVPGFDASKEEYINLDLDQWLKKHKIIQEGNRLGKKNLPPANSSELDAWESKIRDWINRRGRRCRENVSKHLSDLQVHLSDIEDEPGLEVLKQKVTQIENDAGIMIGRKVEKHRITLTQSETDVREGSDDFELFRKQAGLTRLADYSHRTGALWIIFVAFVIESVLNATLLMEVNTSGLLGSIVQMGLISAVNILILALAMGALLRQRNNISNTMKCLGWAGIVLIILLDLIFNIIVGHFRDSMQEILNDVSADIFALGKDTMQRMLESPLGFETFQSILLALLGFLFFAVASWKWYQRDDPYPDYGRRDRQLRDLKNEYIESYNKAQVELEKEFRKYQSQLEDKRHSLEIKQSKRREISQRGNNLVTNYGANLTQYQHDLDYLLSAYRDANKETRTKPPPNHFSEPIQVDPEILVPPSFNPPEETDISGVTDTVSDAIKQVQETFREASRQFQTLENIMEDGRVGTNT